MSNADALVFNDIRFDVIDRNGQPWIQSGQLASALGYKDEGSVRKIYARNSDEFTPAMSVTVNLTRTGGIPTETRIFSLRGCHLLAMFARTPIAKAFRVWVLDVLERLNGCQAEKRKAIPSSPPSHTEADELEHHFSIIKGYLRAIADEEREIFRVVKDRMRPALMAVNTPRRAVAIQSHTAMERLFWSLDYGLEAAEAAVRSALIASRM